MADRFSTNATKREAYILGAANRVTATGNAIEVVYDTYTLATASWSNGDELHIGPIRGEQKIVRATIIGDGTVDLGDDVDVGWAYVDNSSEDEDAFKTAVDMSAGNIDVDGLVLCTNAAPPTNDRDWYLVLSPDDVTGEAAGDATFVIEVTNFR